MALNREMLLQRLNAIAPALSAGDMHLEMMHFNFTGREVIAYNDRIGLSVPINTRFRGAIPGKILLDILSTATHAKDIELSNDNDNVLIEAGGANIKLGILPSERYVFRSPSLPAPNDVTISDTAPLFQGLENCLRSLSRNAVVPDQLGITLIPDGNDLLLFSTDRVTLSHVRISGHGQGLTRCILPAEFCEQALRLHKQGNNEASESMQLVIRHDHVLLVSSHGQRLHLLWGRLIESENPLDYRGVLQRRLPKDYQEHLSEMPRPRFGIALGLAARIADIRGNEARTWITVEKGICKLEAESRRGQALDEVHGLNRQADIKAAVRASLLHAGYEHYSHITISRNCTVMMRDQSMYLIANFDVGEDQ